jgi:hypothetical protein
VAIVLLIPRMGPPWQAALHRFAEVSIGIGVALISAVVWPEREATVGRKVNSPTRRLDADQDRSKLLRPAPGVLPPTTDGRS